jgi:hypothetical protein
MAELKLLSGRVKKVPSANADSNRYDWLNLQNAEPDLGVPTSNGSFFTSGIDGTRFWSDTITVSGNTATINNLTVSNVSNLGNVANVKIFGGNINQVLTTDGLGNLSWSSIASEPGGNSTQIQFNDNGVFGGSDKFTFDKNTGNVVVTNDLTANSVTIGSGVYKFSRISMFYATTISTSTQQLVALDAETLAGVDLTIISTDTTANSRQITKLSIVIYDGDISYNDTSTIAVNNYLSDFSVSYDSGNNLLQVNVAPASNNFMTHKMQITAYDE